MKAFLFSVVFCCIFVFSVFSQSAMTELAEKKEDSLESAQLIADPQLAMSHPDYPVTAGDIYMLTFVNGSTPIQYTIPVDSTYKIRIGNLGLLTVRGLTYNQLKAQIEVLVNKNYAMAGMQFVLVSPAVFLVSISGEVQKAYEEKAWALTRLSRFISFQLTPHSSIRKITVLSAEGKSTDYDLFKAERGDFSQDPYLRPGDKIIINRSLRKITITGAVERPGTYELLDGENLTELISDYGNGLEPLADTSRIELYRKLNTQSESGEKIYLSNSDIFSNFGLENHDTVLIPSFSELLPTIFVEGAIITSDDGQGLEASNKIAAHFNSGEDYAFFIRRNRAWFSTISDLENAYIIRDGKTLPFNLKPMLYDASYRSKVLMQDNDTLMIPFKQYFVSVSGAVKNPGRYPYIPDRYWDYYIGLAGGFIKTENSGKKIKITDISGKVYAKSTVIAPEMTIEAETNSSLYYFNQYAPVLTTVLSLLATSISILVVSGAF